MREMLTLTAALRAPEPSWRVRSGVERGDIGHCESLPGRAFADCRQILHTLHTLLLPFSLMLYKAGGA